MNAIFAQKLMSVYRQISFYVEAFIHNREMKRMNLMKKKGDV